MFDKLITWLTGLADPIEPNCQQTVDVKSATVFAVINSEDRLLDRQVVRIVKKYNFGLELPVESVEIIDEDLDEYGDHQYTVRIEFEKYQIRR